ncbi:MAG: hypothetical protein ACHQ9S_00045 [Candidatus Binatia bacterium]
MTPLLLFPFAELSAEFVEVVTGSRKKLLACPADFCNDRVLPALVLFS